MSVQTAYPHIEQRPDGKLWLTGTQTKVLEVVLDRLAHHWDVDEIRRQHPHLTLGQIHSCLAYYYDHQEGMDRLVEEQLRTVERLRAQQADLIAPGIRRSQAALRRALPELLARERLRGQWVCYAGDERVGIAPTKAVLVRACLQRGLDDDAFYVGKIAPDELVEEEELGPPAPSLLVEEEGTRS